MNVPLQYFEDSVSDIVEKYSTLIFRIALSYTSSNADAEDIMQEVFMRYIKKELTFESSEHEKAWFIRVTVNCCKSILTSPFKKRVIPSSTIDRHCYNRNTISFTGRVYEAVMSLPPKQRLCVYLHYYEDMSVKEIAKSAGFLESTVKSHLFRARKTLKKILKGDNYSV